MSVPLTADRFHRGLVSSLLDLIMTDSVLSTPPTNTPANHSRRGFLTQSALAGAAAAVALSIAPPAMAAIGREPDPAFALIAKKQAADVAHGEAISAQDKAEAEQGAGANGF